MCFVKLDGHTMLISCLRFSIRVYSRMWVQVSVPENVRNKINSPRPPTPLPWHDTCHMGFSHHALVGRNAFSLDGWYAYGLRPSSVWCQISWAHEGHHSNSWGSNPWTGDRVSLYHSETPTAKYMHRKELMWKHRWIQTTAPPLVMICVLPWLGSVA